MRRALAAVAVATLALAGCASPEEPSATESPAAGTSADAPAESPTPESPSASETPSDNPTEDSADAIEVEIEGDRVTPSGERVDAKVGEPIKLHVKSDRAAELHVHSSPEKELAVKPGESTLTIKISTPGIVEVEEHHSGTVILQLEVR